MPCGEGRVVSLVTLLQGIHASTYSTLWEHTVSTRCTYAEGEKGRDSCLYKTSLCDGSMNTFPMQSLPVTFRILCERRKGSPPQPRENKKVFYPSYIPSAFSAHRTTIRSLSSRKIRKFPDRKKRA